MGHGGHHKTKRKLPFIPNEATRMKRAQRKYHVPVIGHFSDKSVLFKSILEAERVTQVQYTLIFEACIGKIYKAGGAYWEFKKGTHYIKYKAFYINAQSSYTRQIGWNG